MNEEIQTHAVLKAEEEAFEDDLISLLDATEDHLKAVQLLEQTLHNGWLNLARARYSVGMLRVGKLQWKENELGTVSIIPSVDQNDSSTCYFKLERRHEPSNLASFNEVGNQMHVVEEVSTHAGISLGQEGKSHVLLTSETSESHQEEDEFEGIAQGKVKHNVVANLKMKDPLNWFGALPPPALRQAKKEFSTSLELIIECANIQQRLTRAQNKMSGSKQQK